MSLNRITAAREQLVASVADWGDEDDVYTTTSYPPDDASLPAVFMSDWEVDDYHPDWSDDIDCTFTIRYAMLMRLPDEAFELADRAMDRATGMPPLIEATDTDTGYIEEVIVRSARTRVILDQEKNTRYLAVDFLCDARLRSTLT